MWFVMCPSKTRPGDSKECNNCKKMNRSNPEKHRK